MSRCYTFPPPGYIKNVPAELELPSKKERHKHKDKDKKKKRKKHSATNSDLIIQEDKLAEEIQQSGLATENFGAGSERLPETRSMLSAAANQGAIQRLQNNHSREKVSSNTNAERLEQRLPSHKLKDEGLSNGALASNSERLRDSVLVNGGLATDHKISKQSLRMVYTTTTTEVLANGMVSTQSKRLKADNLREKTVSNGLAATTSFRRPEQEVQACKLVDGEFSNSVLSTKRRRLQADNHGDKQMPMQSAVLPNDLTLSQKGLQVGNSKYEASSSGMQATNNMRLQADRSGLPIANTPERSDWRSRADADNSSIKAIRDGMQPNSIQAVNVNGKDFSQHLCTTVNRLQANKPKHEVMSNGALTLECQKLQADNFRVKMPLNAVLAAECGGSEKNLQAGNTVVLNGVRDTNIRSLQAANPSSKVFSSTMPPTNCKKSEQGGTPMKEAFPNGVMTASAKTLQAGSAKPEVILHGVRVTSTAGPVQQLQVGTSRQEARPNNLLDAGMMQAEKSQTKMLSQCVLASSYERCDLRLQEDQLRKDTMPNSELASKCEEFSVDGKVKDPPSVAPRAISGGVGVAKDVAPATPSPRVTLERDDELIWLCRHLARPLAEHVCAIADNEEDWLLSYNKELQSKPREMWDSQIPQVWAEAVLLPSVVMHALPYVVPN